MLFLHSTWAGCLSAPKTEGLWKHAENPVVKSAGTTWTASNLWSLISLQWSGSLLSTQIPFISFGVLGVSKCAYLKVGAWFIRVNIFCNRNGRTQSKWLSWSMTTIMLTPDWMWLVGTQIRRIEKASSKLFPFGNALSIVLIHEVLACLLIEYIL